MSRVKLVLPDAFPFTTDIPLRITDINYGGHLGNDAVVSLLHESRIRMLKEHGFTELDVDGRGIIMVDAVVVYKSEAFYGDILQIEVAVQDMTRVGCDFVYRVTNKENGKEVARAKTGIVFYDYQRRTPVGIPEKFRWMFSRV